MRYRMKRVVEVIESLGDAFFCRGKKGIGY